MVWLGPEGKPDFSGLQAALKSGGKGLTYFVFDLLEVDGEDLTRLPNILRKERLRGLIPGQRDAVIQYADHIVGEGEKLLRLMCDAGHEGIIAKTARSEERREGKECVSTGDSRGLRDHS